MKVFFPTTKKKTHETLEYLFLLLLWMISLFEIYKAEEKWVTKLRGVRISQMAMMLAWRSSSKGLWAEVL